MTTALGRTVVAMDGLDVGVLVGLRVEGDDGVSVVGLRVVGEDDDG